MDTYESMIESVLTYLTDYQYCSSLIMANKRCFEKLGAYLNENNISYTPAVAYEWISKSTNLAPSDKGHGMVALARLQDISETGFIRIEHETRHLMSYTILSTTFKDSLDAYRCHMKDHLSDATIENHMHSCAKFLAFVQNKGVKRITAFTAAIVADFFQSAFYFGVHNKSQVNSHVASMLQYFYEIGKVPYGCTVILHYMSYGKQHDCFWNEISQDAHMRIQSCMNSSETVHTDVLHSYKETLVQLHSENGYSKTTMSVNNKAADLLILFLEMNNYNYSPDIAMIWLSEMRSRFGMQMDSFRRVLCMIEEYHYTSKITLTTMHLKKPSKFFLVPEWCRKAAFEYVDVKTKEGWEISTLNMIRSSITRFCCFLNNEGIRSFCELNASHIKRFNVCDTHKTPQGKNAYNGRIRKFLLFLGEKGYLSNPMLFAALSRTNALRETIVVILTEQEMTELTNQFNSNDSKLTFRKKAILLLGLKMGLRASDIVNLSVDDINWSSASIRFVQKKTFVEVNLPMPSEVGNTLFRYITEERGQKSSSKIFLSEKAPRKPIGRAVCDSALRSAFPDRKNEGSGFHVTRKTYATNLLRNGVGVSMVAEALGQSGTASVHRYLSLDTDRMHMCPISLLECGIGGWTDEE